MDADVLNVHKNAGYFIQISKLAPIEDNSVSVVFPESKIYQYNFPAAQYIYRVLGDRIQRSGNRLDDTELIAPFYCLRSLVVLDFGLLCAKRKIDIELAEYTNEENEIIEETDDALYNMFLSPSTKKLQKKEDEFKDIFYETLKGNFVADIAKEKDLYEGYEKIIKILGEGGL